MPSANEFVTQLNSVITSCRDVLRREGITGMDSMKHLTLYILARALDRNECKRLNISENFAWECFLEHIEMDRKQACYDLLYNQNGNDLISHLDSLFGTKNFNFKLKGPDIHIAILKHLKNIDFRAIDGVVDILGTVYENHLGSGSNKSAMRDLGQFFTDRRVCNYMTKLCNPLVLSNGLAESVLDPTMGTGGFLTAYVKHLSGDKINWTAMHDNIAGYDIDEFVMSIGRINVYLSTGVIFDRIAHRNTLNQDVGDKEQRLKFKVILANEPFGVKGLVYKDCCQRVKDLGINGTKSEPLFLNLMMVSLDDGGRCAVVVPDGVLTNDSKQHNGTRKALLDNFELKRVIKMKGQFFSNTGIQPSILFFENTGKPTQAVEFWEVEQDKDGKIIDTHLLTVSRERFDDKCSFDVRQYEEKKVLDNVGDYTIMKLHELFDVKGGKAINKENLNGSKYPYYGCNGVNGYVDEYLFEGEYIICAQDGSIGSVYTVNEKFYPSNHTHIISTKDSNIILNKYGGYYLKYCIDWKPLITSIIPKVTQAKLLDIQLHVPPLTIQQEIVTALDLIHTNANMARKSAESVKAQMVAIMKSVDSHGRVLKAIKDICDYKNGATLDKAEKNDDGQYNVMGGGMDYVGKYNKFNREGYTITISKSGASAGFVKEHNEQFWAGDCFSIYPKLDSLLQKYLYYILKLNPTITTSKITGSTIPHCKWSDICDTEISIPPLPIQQEVIAILNEMEAERATLEQMAEKAPLRAKYILDGYLS